LTESGGTQARAPWRATVLTLFPELFPGPLSASLAGEALKQGLWALEAIGIREFGLGRHRAVDDTPAGGGAGMILRADVLGAAIDHAVAGNPQSPRICLSPRGEPLTQLMVRELAKGPGVLLLAGRFEGIDQRVIEARALREVSIGDYVLSGGELPAMVLIEALSRQVPGVVKLADSVENDSFRAGLLDHPHYTRPPVVEDLAVPEVLTSGDHAAIRRWREREALRATLAKRPDLLAGPEALARLTREQRRALDEVLEEVQRDEK
jgi:tRNA (guanine37-N1)-methyltransferase